MQGMNYNKFFPGHQIAMPPPLQPNQVSYADGTQATLPQEAHDIATFLAWASEPELEVRKRTGLKTILFLIVFTGLLYAVKRKVWAAVH
jgi:ubiquinol-cytochrome c reductase cytochrome c1 subunit